MKTKILIFLVLSSTSLAKAKEGSTSTQTVKGLISVSILGGYNQFRLLNTDSSWAGYTGASYGVGLDLAIMSFGQGGALALFGQSTWSGSKGAELDTNTINQQDLLYGMKVLPVSYFFLGAGIGTSTNDTKTSVTNENLKSSVTALGLGLDFQIGNSWFAGIQAWYKTGTIKKSGTLTENSAVEGVNTVLALTWSPPLTTIIYNSK
jgi:hypothetical protein